MEEEVEKDDEGEKEWTWKKKKNAVTDVGAVAVAREENSVGNQVCDGDVIGKRGLD